MLVADQQDKDLGELKLGVPHEFTYVLENQGTTDLKIKKITAGCHSCTHAKIKRTFLSPTEKTNLNVTFSPGVLGSNLKSISIVYDEDKELKLKFRAIING